MNDHPLNVVSAFRFQWNEWQFDHRGRFEDGRNALLYFRDRELELRRAIQAPTWLAMRALPGVTNPPEFRSEYTAHIPTALRWVSSSYGIGRRLAPMAAFAEVRRRIVVTVLALERYHKKWGVYPQTLAALAPDFIQSVPVDFIDGSPFSYRPTEDGRFSLCCLGFEGVDTGGGVPSSEKQRVADDLAQLAGSDASKPAAAFVWPRPAADREAADVLAKRKTPP